MESLYITWLCTRVCVSCKHTFDSMCLHTHIHTGTSGWSSQADKITLSQLPSSSLPAAMWRTRSLSSSSQRVSLVCGLQTNDSRYFLSDTTYTCTFNLYLFLLSDTNYTCTMCISESRLCKHHSKRLIVMIMWDMGNRTESNSK